MTKYYRAKASFVAPGPDGSKRLVNPDPVPDCLIPAGHWVLEGREAMFDEFTLADVPEDATVVRSVAPGPVEGLEEAEDDESEDQPVEQATAAPGERRTTRKQTAAKKAAPKKG